MAGPFAFVPIETLLLEPRGELWRDLGPASLLVYLALRAAQQRYTHSGGRRGSEARRAKSQQTFFESEARLGKRVGLSVSTVKRALILLRAVGLLELTELGGPGRANRYRLPEVTPALIAEALEASRIIAAAPKGQRARVIAEAVEGRARMGHPEPIIGSQRTDHRVTVNRYTGHSELRSRSEIESRNGEMKSRDSGSLSAFETPTTKNTPFTRETEILRYRAFLELHKGKSDIIPGVCRALAAALGCTKEEAEALLIIPV